MTFAQYAQRIRPRIERELRESAYEGEYPDDVAFQKAVDAVVEEAVSDAEFNAAQERQAYGDPEDSPRIQSADIWGTGEGRFHGII